MTSGTTYRMCTRHVVQSRRNSNKINCLWPMRVPGVNPDICPQPYPGFALLTTWLGKPVDVVASLGDNSRVCVSPMMEHCCDQTAAALGANIDALRSS